VETPNPLETIDNSMEIDAEVSNSKRPMVIYNNNNNHKLGDLTYEIGQKGQVLFIVDTAATVCAISKLDYFYDYYQTNETIR